MTTPMPKPLLPKTQQRPNNDVLLDWRETYHLSRPLLFNDGFLMSLDEKTCIYIIPHEQITQCARHLMVCLTEAIV